MMSKRLMSRASIIGGALALATSISAFDAWAVEPLNVFVEAAHRESFDAREQDAVLEQRTWEARAALGRLLPSFTARGSLTHNQYKAVLPAGTFPGQTEDINITPQNQLDGIFQLDVILVDMEKHARYSQAKHIKRAAEAQRESVDDALVRSVAQSYFTYIGASALVEAAEQSLQNAEQNFDYVRSRNELGVATDLDQERASANVERAKQDLADARLVRLTASRQLETLTGLSPSPVHQYPVDDLHHEASLNRWIENTDTPTDRVQKELQLAAKSAKKAANYALLPTLSASAQERISNATGFTGQVSSYTLSAVLSWRLDYAAYSNARAQSAAAQVQSVQVERTRRNVEDAVFNAYHGVETSIVKSASARAQAQAAHKAAALAAERYKVGAVTQLEVTQSQREAFQAEAARVKADADLALSRIVLRVAAGQPWQDEVPTASSERPLQSPIGVEDDALGGESLEGQSDAAAAAGENGELSASGTQSTSGPVVTPKSSPATPSTPAIPSSPTTPGPLKTP